MRRKTLNNNLKDIFDADTIDKIYSEMNIDRNVRAEQLSLDDYLKMYKTIYER